MSAGKTLFIAVAEPVIVRNIMRTDFARALVEGSRARLVIITTPTLRASLREEFGPLGYVVESVSLSHVSFLDKLLGFFARNGFYSGTNDIMQRRAAIAHESRVPPFVKRTLGHLIGNLYPVRALLRWCERFVPREPSIAALFERYSPESVFSTILMNGDIDVPLMREARARGIRTIGMVRSWDNLTGFGYLRLLPDRFLAQSAYVAEVAAEFNDMPHSRTAITGLPHYDHYVDESIRTSREAFCARLGLDAEKKIILYGAIGEFLFPHEADMARVIGRVASALDAQAIFRPHPAFPMRERIADMTGVVLDDGQLPSLPHLIDTLVHADVLVTAGSTLMVDAACFDTPVVSVAFDGEREAKDPWLSVARFYEYFTHIVRLIDRTHGVRIVKSESELLDAVRAYLLDPSLDGAGRTGIVEYFASPLGGSGRRLAEAVSHAPGEGRGV